MKVKASGVDTQEANNICLFIQELTGINVGCSTIHPRFTMVTGIESHYRDLCLKLQLMVKLTDAKLMLSTPTVTNTALWSAILVATTLY